MTPAPEDDEVGLRTTRALAVVRLTLGAMFVWVFFENLEKGAYTPTGYAGVINHYLSKGLAPDAWKAVMSFMAANATVAGRLQAVAEIAFGVLLTLGAATRVTALAAAVFLASLWISEWGTAWIWELLVPTLAAAAVAYGAGGRRWGLDGWLAARYPNLPIW